ncbi:MAG TPA: putative quinol monooxygenase [Candidatus Dormibacteraeota bacterium]|nr:putative quinol monooxygenase [Candidatus Dormibacteraeota bacterium]
MTLAVAVTWHARPGTEDRLEAILTEMSTLTRAEPGCLIYQPHRSLDAPGVFFIYERFADEAAFTAHLDGEQYRRLVIDEAVALLEHRERSLYAVIEAAPTVRG